MLWETYEVICSAKLIINTNVTLSSKFEGLFTFDYSLLQILNTRIFVSLFQLYYLSYWKLCQLIERKSQWLNKKIPIDSTTKLMATLPTLFSYLSQKMLARIVVQFYHLTGDECLISETHWLQIFIYLQLGVES